MRRFQKRIKRYSEQDHKFIVACRDIFLKLKPEYSSGSFIPVSHIAAELTLMGGWWTSGINQEITSTQLENLLLEKFGIALETRARGERGYYRDVFERTFSLYLWRRLPEKPKSPKVSHADFWRTYHRIADYVFTAKSDQAPYYTDEECMEHVRLQTVLRQILEEMLSPRLENRSKQIDKYVLDNPHRVLKFDKDRQKDKEPTSQTQDAKHGPYGPYGA